MERSDCLNKAFFDGKTIRYIEGITDVINYSFFQCLSICQEVEGYSMHSNTFIVWHDATEHPYLLNPIDPTIPVKIKKMLHYHYLACSAILERAKKVKKSRHTIHKSADYLLLLGLHQINISNNEVVIEPLASYAKDWFNAFGDAYLLERDYKRIFRMSKELIININESIWEKLPT